jgi:ribonuclease HI
VIDAHGFPRRTVSEVCGDGTSNQAAYLALLRALDLCRANPRITDVVVYSSSELPLRQMAGEYTVKDAHLQQLHARAPRYCLDPNVAPSPIRK